MKPPIKFLLALLSAGLVVALAFFGWSAKAKDESTFPLANGVQVTPIEVKPDDVAQLLDIKRWKFDVTLPKGKRTYVFPVSLYRNGTYVQSLGGASCSALSNWTGERHESLFIGMLPVSGDFMHANQINAKYGHQEQGIYFYNTNTFANPFLRTSSHTTRIEPTAEPQAAEKYGGICLMSGSVESSQQDQPPDNVEIVMTFQEVPNPT